MCQPHIESVALSDITQKHLLVNEKGDVGMAEHVSKKYGTRDELSKTCNPKKLFQDACQHLIL